MSPLGSSGGNGQGPSNLRILVIIGLIFAALKTNKKMGKVGEMQRRNLLVSGLLAILTFGIYPIVWSCITQDQFKRGTGQGFTWIGHLIMLFITFGIYNIFWHWRAGQRINMLGGRGRGVLYAIFSIFPILSIISLLLIQNAINALPAPATQPVQGNVNVAPAQNTRGTNFTN